jgi:CheY-like chemotaxis protein
MKHSVDIKHLVFRDTSFARLMSKRIFNVLLVAAPYDAFMLEEDGRIDEQLFNEYTSLSLRYPPRFTQVATREEALAALKRMSFELVIVMPNMDEEHPFAILNAIKADYPHLPAVVLTPFSKNVTQRLEREDLSAVDYVFSWLGNAELLLAIIKLLEDRINADDDVASAGVQTILLVEDSIRFYSAALPHLYKFVLLQSQDFAKEALNAHQRTLRMRGRPKVLLARSYEEAEQLWRRYRNNMLGIVCDMSFTHDGKKDPLAGVAFAKAVKTEDRWLPFLFESSEADNRHYAEEMGCCFIDKNSKTFPQDLHREIYNNFGFGDFIIMNPQTRKEVMRVTSLVDLQKKIFDIPQDSLVFHLSHNHFSRFFYSRAIFPVAEFLKGIDVSEYRDMNEARTTIFDAIVSYRRMKNEGVVAAFDKSRFDEYSNFARIGENSLGGKGRGLAFMAQLLKRRSRQWDAKFPAATVKIPRSVVVATDWFDVFMETNSLYEFALRDVPNDEILARFLAADLPQGLMDDLSAFLEVAKAPVAVRSSSLLEDAHYQPFAGVYNTYMVATQDNPQARRNAVFDAVKAVYASVFFTDSKAYMTATSNLIEQEKMAVVIQEVVGSAHGTHFYPAISGVARSLNFYPIGEEKPHDGIAQLALGLGKYIMDGGLTLRFSPRHPHAIVQTSTPEIALRDTQKTFYALDTAAPPMPPAAQDDYNMLRLAVNDLPFDPVFARIVSTYNPDDNTLLDGFYPNARRRVLTFYGVLQDEEFPLADIISHLLEIGEQAMGRPVEMEFAADLERAAFYLLQIRPIVDMKEVIDEDLSRIDRRSAWLYSAHALGHGNYTLSDVIYLPTAGFSPSHNTAVAETLDLWNRRLAAEGRNCALIAPGRWGSSDPWLGVPVRWSQISQARLIVELSLQDYAPEPSQGTHFFHNLTSFGVGYFTVGAAAADSFFNEYFLASQPLIDEANGLRHVRIEHPSHIKIDGRKNIGVALM